MRPGAILANVYGAGAEGQAGQAVIYIYGVDDRYRVIYRYVMYPRGLL